MMVRVNPWLARYWRRLALITALCVLAAGLIYVYSLVRQIQGLSAGTAAACQQVKRLGEACVANPPASIRANPAEPTRSAVPGPSGPAGANGRSIIGARIDSCRLILIRDDSREFDAGPVCGARGAQGSPGPTGSPGANGKDGANGSNGTDGQNGASITGVRCTDTHFIVTISTTGDIDLGAGSCGQGPKGDPGEPVHSYTYTVHGVAGVGDTTYLCTWDGDSTSEPHYDCQQQ